MAAIAPIAATPHVGYNTAPAVQLYGENIQEVEHLMNWTVALLILHGVGDQVIRTDGAVSKGGWRYTSDEDVAAIWGEFSHCDQLVGQGGAGAGASDSLGAGNGDSGSIGDGASPGGAGVGNGGGGAGGTAGGSGGGTSGGSSRSGSGGSNGGLMTCVSWGGGEEGAERQGFVPAFALKWVGERFVATFF